MEIIETGQTFSWDIFLQAVEQLATPVAEGFESAYRLLAFLF